MNAWGTALMGPHPTPLLCLGPHLSHLRPCMCGKQWSVITRSSYSSSTSRSSRRLRRWWECFPFCGALGGHWQLLPDEPASASYASPPALSPWTARRRHNRDQSEGCAGEGGGLLEDYCRIKLEHHTHTHTQTSQWNKSQEIKHLTGGVWIQGGQNLPEKTNSNLHDKPIKLVWNPVGLKRIWSEESVSWCVGSTSVRCNLNKQHVWIIEFKKKRRAFRSRFVKASSLRKQLQMSYRFVGSYWMKQKPNCDQPHPTSSLLLLFSSMSVRDEQ